MTITIKRIGATTLRVEVGTTYHDYIFSTFIQARAFVKKSIETMEAKGHNVVTEGF